MRPFGMVQTHLDKHKDVPIIRAPARRLTKPRLKLLIIIILLIVYITVIVVTVVLNKRSKAKNSSSLSIRVTTISNFPFRTYLFQNLTSSNIITVPTQTVSLITGDPIFSLTSMINNSSIEVSETTNNYQTTISPSVTTETFASNRYHIDAIISTSSTTMSTTTVIPSNLLENPGAEEQLKGWMQTESTLAIADTNGKFNKNYYPRSGSYCFAGGKASGSSLSKLVQRITLMNTTQCFTEQQLDSGKLRAYVSFYYQTWHSPLVQNDIVKVDMTLRSDKSDILGGIHTGELKCRTFNPGWCHYLDSTPVPAGTRVIHYVMLFYKNDLVGSNIDVYIDDNSLIIM